MNVYEFFFSFALFGLILTVFSLDFEKLLFQVINLNAAKILGCVCVCVWVCRCVGLLVDHIKHGVFKLLLALL